VYLVPERGVPTLSVEAWIEGGEGHLPKEKRGLAKLTAALLRDGGIEGMDARALDARLDALAATIEVDAGTDGLHAALWTLSKNADEALRLFAGVLLRPTFAEERIRRAKDDLRDEIAHRDDEPDAQLDQKVRELVYGDGPLSWRETAATVDALTRDEIAAWHRAAYRPNGAVFAVAGDFDREAMQKRLETLFGEWKPGPLPFDPPAVARARRPGVFLLDRPLNQGFVEVATQGVEMGHRDEVALSVMNYILGGGGFTSRITGRVRNAEGLAYSAGSYARPGRGRPGTVALYFQSAAESTAYALKLCFEEARRFREEGATADELARAKAAIRDAFPERFATARSAAAALAQAEFDGRPPDWYDGFRAKVEAVTLADVGRVAKEHLRLEEMSVVVVGPRAVVAARDEAHAAGLAEHAKEGRIEMLTPE
jgi:predicted Zn-dependent peptidase